MKTVFVFFSVLTFTLLVQKLYWEPGWRTNTRQGRDSHVCPLAPRVFSRDARLVSVALNAYRKLEFVLLPVRIVIFFKVFLPQINYMIYSVVYLQQ